MQDKAGPTVFGRNAVWLNEPKKWSGTSDELIVETDERTDFWRETHYGFIHDNGHFLGFHAGDAFTAQVRVRAHYQALYDQAGLMVRVDAHRWIKAGIEFSDGHPMLSSVLTDGRSDWCTAQYRDGAHDFWLRITVAKGVIRLQVSADGKTWPLVRLAPFPVASDYLVGPMCCTPERHGLSVRFSNFELGPPNGKDLHDIS